MGLARGTALSLALGIALVRPSAARADATFDLDGVVDTTGPDHVLVPFEVPAGTQEIEIVHTDLSDEDILDFGLNDPSGFRGWGGGNTEPIVVTENAASRSYLTGPITPGTWHLVIGKALLDGGDASYHATVNLRDVPTLPAQPERAPYEDPGVRVEGARWYAGDFHVHSRESGDADATLEEIAALAQERGLDFVEISDHNTTSQLDFLDAAHAGTPSFLFLPGVEFTTYDGHANGIGATAFVDHKIGLGDVTIGGAMAAFEAQGALFSINHPAFALGDACIGCAWTHDTSAGTVHAVELVTAGSASVFIEQTLAFYEALAASGQRPAALGGSDDHRAGEDLGAFGTPIGSPTTMVFAEELSVEGIKAGIRAGRTVVKARGPDDPMVELTDDEAGVSARVTGGEGHQLRFVVDGVAGAFEPIEGEDVTIEAALEPGAHRVRAEVWDETQIATLTSFVFVDVAEPSAERGRVTPLGGGCGIDARAATASVWTVGLVLGALAARRRSQRERTPRRSTERLGAK